ncbi:hypothetical protein ACEU07_20925 [Chromobacterium violaceum]|uniref:hypothetical protein n=1 Tax=Chromobacterium violaceum TaxID=536 RepID=UPI0035A6A0DB
MDINEFEKQTPPKAKRSRLEPFRNQIFELKARGYANWQIAEYLKQNGVSVTQEAVRKYIKSRESDLNALSVASSSSGKALVSQPEKKETTRPESGQVEKGSTAGMTEIAKTMAEEANPVPKFKYDEL